MPWYASAAFGIWLASCIVTVTFSKGKDKKWYERMMPSFVLTIILSIIFLTAMDTDYYMFDDNNGLRGAPTLSLPMFYIIGKWLKVKWQVNKEIKHQEFNKGIDKQISDKNAEIRNLEQSVKTKTVITHFVEMLDCCGEDMSDIASDPRVSSILKIVSEINKEKEQIQLLQKQKKS